jgi:membrane glycosyltransferase
MTHIATVPVSDMPALCPLDFPEQAFNVAYRDAAAPYMRARAGLTAVRLAVFVPAGLATAGFMAVFLNWFSEGGVTGVEATLAALIGFGIFWIVLSLCTAVLGAVAYAPHLPPHTAQAAPALDVALLMPIYNEPAPTTFGNAAAMLEALGRSASRHRYSLYMLSDTRDTDLARQEAAAFARLRRDHPQGARIFYRRRVVNTDRKVGNLADWVSHWGGGHDAMLVLDADSLMSAQAILALSDILAADPNAGLVQSCPQLIGGQTVFARVQEFGNTLYGAALARGLARWTGQEGNYWGHNAIIRTAAFAASAGLPKMRGGALILSHDFVEAGLMRRAGWAIRFEPHIGGSWEETPPSLLDHIARDRRWCQGNLQHLRLLGARGFHGVSRFHLLHGAVGYLLSPLWFALLAIWALIGPTQSQSVIAYFSPDMPLRPTWPQIGWEGHLWSMALVYALLLAPKAVGIYLSIRTMDTPLGLRGWRRYGGGVLAELALSILYAPILMVQQTRAVLGVALGRSVDWVPQPRGGAAGYRWRDLMRAHTTETVLGAALVWGLAQGLIAPWLAPVALSLICAVPLSWLSGRPLRSGWLPTPQSMRPPAIRRAALAWQRRLAADRLA